MLDSQGADGFSVVDQFRDDVERQILFNYGDEGVLGSKMGHEGGGIFDPLENVSVQSFFHKLTKIFKNINFYNLLDITHDPGNKDSEQAGNEDV